MNIAFCSLLQPEEKKISERIKGYMLMTAVYKFAKAIIEGLDENLDDPVKIFNIINALNYPKFPDLIFKTEQWHHTDGSLDWHIGYVNLFGIKYITQTCNLYRKLSAWVKEKGGEKCLVCVHHIFLPSVMAAYLLKKRYPGKVTLCLITGDIPGRFGAVPKGKSIKQRLIWHMGKIINALAKRYDCFVFVTKDMAEAFGVEGKPFTVVEAVYGGMDSIAKEAVNTTASTTSQKENRVIFYAGAIKSNYGIEHLLRAFSEIQGTNYRLWLAGGGSAVPAVQEYAAKDTRVEFLGLITPQEVEQRQREATVLISPRTSEHEYVKYSFPGKTMECLASGKPYIAHRLPCDPPEYAAHIQYADNETDEALRDKIIEICELPAEKREEIGRKAREFILEEKNPKVMCGRIVDMWKGMV